MMLPRFQQLTEADFNGNCELLTAAGFSDAPSAVTSLMRLRQVADRSGSRHRASQQRTVPAWFKTLKRVLQEAPRPDAVLTAVDQFVRNFPDAPPGLPTTPEHPQSGSRTGAPRTAGDPVRATLPLMLFEQSPRSLDLLSRLACGSPFLTQILLTDPVALEVLVTRQRIADMKPREQFLEEALEAISGLPNLTAKLSQLRRFQRLELLRIGTCDAFGLLDLKVVTLQISLLADAMVQVCLQLACQQYGVTDPPFSVLALGKHGGEELNYSSDIDLIMVAEQDSAAAQKIARTMVEGLGTNLPTGFLYRVDLRLRPWGDAGPLVSTPDSFQHYLVHDAQLWERQALLKARVIAGDPRPGQRLLKTVAPQLFTASPDEVRNSIQEMKDRIEQRLRRHGKLHTEVKLGAGSIRDIEFFVQALQLIHGRDRPELLSPNTLDALVRLTDADLIDGAVYRCLREGYVFLRAVEHTLQLLHNQQTHEIPADPRQREWLARRLDYPDGATLLSRFEDHRRAVRHVFESQFERQPEIPQQKSPERIVVVSSLDTAAEALQGDAENDTLPPSELAARQRQLDDLFRDIEQGSLVRVAVETDLSQPGQPAQKTVRLIICSHDVPGLLSMVCGVLFAESLDIRRGEATSGMDLTVDGLRLPPDRFLAVMEIHQVGTSLSVDLMAEHLETQLSGMLQLQRAGQAERVRADLIELFCRRVRSLPATLDPTADVQISLSEPAVDVRTVIEITGQDTSGFLFELANALSICRYRIHRAEIETRDGQVRDVLHVAEIDGSPVRTQRRREELQTAVTLIKQFTHWLPSNSDPHHALIRFRDLLQKLLADAHWPDDVASLNQPRVLQAIARVLGMSRFLWDDFLQVHHADLFPLLARADQLRTRISRDDLTQELQQNLQTATDPAEALNAFKDRHLFRIDLRHVLGHCRPFGAFSVEITELAEVIVQAAATLAWNELSARHGEPITETQTVCPYTLAALGKFGGVEMGFASDIELVLVFAEHCRTDGKQSVSAATFFERLVTRITELIAARRAGIFQIDLRMRPYGQAGSAAVQLDEFCNYYAVDGDAWPYERQALVKLRCLPADRPFSDSVCQACHTVIYSPEAFDFDAMRAMREKQTRQLVRGGTVNAKLSEGGLVDCEYAVQALQLTFGQQIPALRTSNTLQALSAAAKHQLVSDHDYETVREAYIFLRELIDCLRMVRGNALDLTVPASDSVDYRHLARRMEIVHDSQISLDRLEEQMQVVRNFAATVELRCRGANTGLGRPVSDT